MWKNVGIWELNVWLFVHTLSGQFQSCDWTVLEVDLEILMNAPARAFNHLQHFRRMRVKFSSFSSYSFEGVEVAGFVKVLLTLLWYPSFGLKLGASLPSFQNSVVLLRIDIEWFLFQHFLASCYGRYPLVDVAATRRCCRRSTAAGTVHHHNDVVARCCCLLWTWRSSSCPRQLYQVVSTHSLLAIHWRLVYQGLSICSLNDLGLSRTAALRELDNLLPINQLEINNNYIIIIPKLPAAIYQ